MSFDTNINGAFLKNENENLVSEMSYLYNDYNHQEKIKAFEIKLNFQNLFFYVTLTLNMFKLSLRLFTKLGRL